jgi:hypothetical protein
MSFLNKIHAPIAVLAFLLGMVIEHFAMPSQHIIMSPICHQPTAPEHHRSTPLPEETPSL